MGIQYLLISKEKVMAKLESRKYHIALLFSFFFVIYLSRLFYVGLLPMIFTNRAKNRYCR